MALIAQADLEAKLGRSLSSSEATYFAILNPALQAHVEQIIGSRVESASVTTRYFDGGFQHLPINPCTDLASVTQVDDDDVVIYTYDTSDYTADPKNRTIKTQLRHRNGPFMRGISNIAVTAKFSIAGDAGVLAIVKNTMLDILKTGVLDTSNITRESIEGYTVDFSKPETQAALAPIKFMFPGV